MVKLLQLQTKFKQSKEATLAYIADLIATKMTYKPDCVALPEMFACPYDNAYFPEYAEARGGRVYKFCSILAKKYHIYLFAGSLPEIDEEGHIYNVAYVFDDEGREIARHAKMHLFDIDIKGGQYFKESDTLTAGDNITVFGTKWGKMSLCICYDFRFPELARLMVNKGAQIIFVPAAFNQTTGPLHWELMFRSRAVDNQVFTVGTAPAYDEGATYHSWGHSLVVSPWGQVLNCLDKQEGYLITDINLKEVAKVREQLPLLKHRRRDIYQLRELK